MSSVQPGAGKSLNLIDRPHKRYQGTLMNSAAVLLRLIVIYLADLFLFDVTIYQLSYCMMAHGIEVQRIIE